MHICWKEGRGGERKRGKDRGRERREKKGVRERWRKDQKGEGRRARIYSSCRGLPGLYVLRPTLKLQGGHTVSC